MTRTILIVDDNGEERTIFSTYLEFVGGRLLQAANGSEGLAMAREHRPDLILLDITMPVMDGWEMMRRLRDDPSLAVIPVLAITSHHLPPERLEEAGFRGYLEKPISPYRVLQEAERHLGALRDFDETPARGAASNAMAGRAA